MPSRYYRDGMKKSKRRPLVDPVSLAPKATAGSFTLHSRAIGALPIINRFIQRCRIRETLEKFLPAEDGRNRVNTAILLLVRNILISREPIYGLGEWAAAFAECVNDSEITFAVC